MTPVHRILLLLGTSLLAAASARAQEPPETLTRTISTSSQSLAVDFTRYSIRNANFQVFVQQPDGSYSTHAAGVSRTYLGTVQGRPDAIACGLLRADNTLLARISFEDGTTWTTTGGTASASGSSFIPAWPTTVVSAGGAGSSVFAAELGIDSTFNHFTACGGNADSTLERIEFSVLSANMVYLRDAAITHRLGKIVMRANSAQNPYAPDGGDTGGLLTRVRSLWNAAAPMGTSHDIAAVVHSAANGGLAYVGTIATSSRYSSNDSDPWGDFSVVWRHEAGHNWSSSHYEGGGNPEGATIMSNNGLSRFSSSELRKIISHRNSKSSSLENLGAFSLPLPPRANQDTASFLRNTPVRIDVMANDSDSNGHSLSLHSFDITSSLGAAITRSTGTGPGGRDEILYTPPATLKSGTDWFRYRIQDSSGMQAVGYAMVRPRSETLVLADHWKLDDPAGTTASNAIRSTHQGTHENGVSTDQTGANSVTRRGITLDGSNDRVSIPAPGYATNTLTFTAWIRRDGSQNANAAIVFSRAGSTTAGFHFGTANELRYTWDGGAYTWNSSLTVPDNTWCLAAMCVSPSGTTLHLRTPGGLNSATNTANHASEAFNGIMYLGWDSNNNSRHFRGSLDDVRVYKSTLSAADIESLYQQASGPPAVALVEPAAGASIPPLNATFAASVSGFIEITDRVDFVENENPLATSAAPPWQAVVSALTPGSRTVTARAYFGDWGYSVDSAPVSFTALPAPVPVVTIAASLPASKSGPVPGSFIFTRDHPIGEITVTFSQSGSAVPGTDIEPLPASITFPDGSLAATLVVTPIAAPPDSTSESVTLTIAPGSTYQIGTPSAATLTIDDHVTSIAAGEWDVPETWNSNAAAPVTGTQNSGPGHSIAHAVTSNSTGSNSQALVAGYLRVKSGGVLDLARLHAATNQNVAYNLPDTTVESGGSIQFRCSTGSSTHTVAANLDFRGNSTLRINGGSYANKAVLSGVVAGSGEVQIISDTNAGSTSADLRQISITRANNPFAGNWSVSHTPSGDDFAALRAAASNALGTGTVTIGRRSRLINDNGTGLNSLNGVILNGDTSLLALNQPWNNPAATLSLTGGSPAVQLGNATSEIGNLSGSVGSITGSGSSSNLVIHQTTQAQFAGTLSSNLRFTKSGPALLSLTQQPDASLRLVVQQGTLAMPSTPSTVASFDQSGGVLRVDLPPAGQSALTVTGNITHTSGGIEVALPGGPPPPGQTYTLLAYQGALSGQPEITFDTEALAIIDYGTGTNSAITATFYELYDLTVLPSHPERGEASGGGPYISNTSAAIHAVAAPGWRFIRWSGDGIADPTSPVTSVLVDTPKTVIAEFDRPRSVWIQPISGGSWSDNANWDIAPVFTADEWLDFSTLDLTAPHSTTLDANRTAGGLRFADLPTASHDWTLSPGSGGNLTLATTTGLPPEIEVINRSASLTSSLAGTQGLAKSGAGTLVLNHPSNTIAGPIAVLNGILQIRDGSTNSPTLFDAILNRTITIGAGATLDLPRLHAFTVQTVNWSLPPLAFQDGSTLRFRASTGSNNHQLSSPLEVSGTVTINNNGGSYAQDIDLTGSLAGTGTIQYLSTSGSGAATTTRTLTLSNPNNTFSGNWFVDYTGSTSDDFAALRSLATGSLGTGTVTLEDRARLIAGATASLDSLAGVTLAKATSTLDLQSHAWANPAAALDVQNGTVEAAAASLSIGSLSQAGGLIRLQSGDEFPAPLNLTGSVVFSGGSIEFTVTGDPSGKTFEILRYGGSLTGTPTITVLGADRLVPVISFGTGTNDAVTVTFPNGANLVWRGDHATNPGVWDIGVTENWTRAGSPDHFLQNDHVRFDDTAVSIDPILTGEAAPSSVTFANNSASYALGGTGSITGPAAIVKSGSGPVTLGTANSHTGGTFVSLGVLTASHSSAFGSGAVEVSHQAASTTTTRINLLDAVISNPVILDSNARTGFRGAINTAAGNILSIVSGPITVKSNVGNGGHFSSLDGGVLRLAGTLESTGPVPNIRSGTVEMATTGGNLTELSQGEGTIRLVANNGIQPNVRLSLAVSAAGTLDLNGHSQTLGQLRRHTTHTATVTNNAATASVLTIDSMADHTFSGAITNGTGGITLVKQGASRFDLTGASAYQGETRVEEGILAFSSPSLADAAAVHITADATLRLDFSGTDSVAALFIDSVAQPPGIYGAPGSGAPRETNRIAGTGTLNVTSGPVTDYASWEFFHGITGSGPNADLDHDDIPNGIEFVIGGIPVGSGADSSSLLPTVTRDASHLSFEFRRSTASAGYESFVQFTSDLNEWTTAQHGVSGVVIDEFAEGFAPGLDKVIVRIPLALALNGRLLARLAVRIP